MGESYALHISSLSAAKGLREVRVLSKHFEDDSRCRMPNQADTFIALLRSCFCDWKDSGEITIDKVWTDVTAGPDAISSLDAF